MLLKRTSLQLALSVLIFAVAPSVFAVSVGESLSHLAVKHVESGILDSKSLQGKVTLINFWATWCEACKVEIAEMEQKFKPLAQDPKVQIAFVSLDKDSAQAKAWFQSHLKEPEFWLKRLYADPLFATADALKIDAFPMTLVVGPKGEVLHAQKGFKDGEGTTEALVTLLQKTKESLP